MPKTLVFKLVLVLICLSLIPRMCDAQTRIYGHVTDARTHSALPLPTVYVNNTFNSTVGNLKGEYSIRIPPGVAELVFSYVGYEPVRIKLTIKSKENLLLDMQLSARPKNLNEVQVKGGGDKDWEKYIKEFKRVFIGEGKNAKETRILNAQDVDLWREKKRGLRKILRAKGQAPIEIQNRALGYSIRYELIDFSSASDVFKFNGFVLFRELKPKDSAELSKWKLNRLNAYKGSQRHLFKSIVQNNLDSSGFALYVLRDSINPSIRSPFFKTDSSTIIKRYWPRVPASNSLGSGIKSLLLPSKITVFNLNGHAKAKVYRDVVVPVAGLELSAKSLMVDNNGVILNQEAVLTSGYLSEPRISDLLPNEYDPKLPPAYTMEKILNEKYDVVRTYEKPYLHTDKSYYYPTEMIWLKGYINYITPEIKDSLSGVIHIDLINKRNKILESKVYPIDSGTFIGNIHLPDTLRSGTYYLRAYTEWMRNFENDSLFMKAIPVLDFHETTKSAPIKSNSKEDSEAAFGLVITSDRPSYEPRELITFKIKNLDQNDKPIVTNLSVSVTDVNQVGVRKESNIMTDFEMSDDSIQTHRKRSEEGDFNIERGITIAGKYKPLRGKKYQAIIKIIQGDLEDMTDVITDSNGNFWVSGFDFRDSLDFEFMPFDLKHVRLNGTVHLKSSSHPSPPSILPKANIEIIMNNQIDPHSARGRAGDHPVLLKEIDVKAKRFRRPNVELADADILISGQDLYKSNNPDILAALQSRVPGFGVTLDGALVLGQKTQFHNNEVLLLIDGSRLTGNDGQANTLQLLSYANIKTIQVYRSGTASSYGRSGTVGVIAITTRKGERSKYSDRTFDKTVFQTEKIKGFSAIENFVGPSYLNQNVLESGDYRSTLYWSPSIKIDSISGGKEISFFAADLETTYRIIAEGVTANWTPVHAEFFITIRRKDR